MTDAQKKVEEAQNLQDAEKHRSLGYFKQKNTNSAKTAVEILESASATVTNGTNHAGVKEGLTHIGEADDATSLENMKKALELIKHGNDLRTTDDNFKGLSPLKVSDRLMAYAQASSNMESQFVGHWIPDDGPYEKAGYAGENAAWGYSNVAGNRDHYAGWYTEEKSNYEARKGDQTGHYLNIVSTYFTETGLGCNTRNSGGRGNHYGTTATQNFGASDPDAVDFETYYNDFMAYYNKIQNAKKVLADAQAALQKALADQKTAADKLTAAQTTLDNANMDLTAAKQKVKEANQKVTDTQAAVATAESNLEKVSKDTDPAQTLKDAQSAYEAAVTVRDTAKQTLNDKNTDVTNAQNAVDDAATAVTTAQNNLDELQKTAADAKAKYKTTQKAADDAGTALDKANTELSTKQTVADNLKKDYNEKFANLQTAQQNLETAKEDVAVKTKQAEEAAETLKNVQANAKAIADARNTLNAANEKLKEAESKANEAATALDNARKAVDEKTKAFNDAKSDTDEKSRSLESAKADATKAEKAVSDAQSAYDAAAKALKQAETARDEAQKNHDDLSTVKGRVAEFENKLTELGKNAEEAQYNSDNLNVQLTNAKTGLAAAQNLYQNAREAYDKLLADQKINTTATYTAAEISVNADGSITFKSDADFKKFKAVQVDGKMVSHSDYTVTEGSTVINLHKSFVDTLSKGEHSITIVSEDGSATTRFTHSDNKATIVNNNAAKNNADVTPQPAQAYVAATPDTGDSMNSATWIFLVTVSLITAGGAVYLKRTKA